MGGAAGGSGGGGGAAGGAGGTGGRWVAIGEVEVSCEGLAPVPLEELCAALAGAECRSEQRCNWLPEDGFEDCRSWGVRHCGVFVLADSVAAGRLRYDPVQAACCLAHLAGDQSCWRLRAPRIERAYPECAAAFVGLVPDGGSCRHAADCTTGACDLRASCPGTCVPKLAPGAHCSVAGDETALPCADGHRCRSPWSGMEGFCEPIPPLDARCAEAIDCATDWTCQVRDGERRCVPAARLGERCVEIVWCAQPWICREGICGRRFREGESCEPGECEVGLWCDTAAEPDVCRPQAREGEPCTRRSCAPPLLCDEAAGICTRRLGPGGVCVVPGSISCDEGYCATGEVCAAYRPPGDPCSSRTVCESAWCQSGVCAAEADSCELWLPGWLPP